MSHDCSFSTTPCRDRTVLTPHQTHGRVSSRPDRDGSWERGQSPPRPGDVGGPSPTRGTGTRPDLGPGGVVSRLSWYSEGSIRQDVNVGTPGNSLLPEMDPEPEDSDYYSIVRNETRVTRPESTYDEYRRRNRGLNYGVGKRVCEKKGRGSRTFSSIATTSFGTWTVVTGHSDSWRTKISPNNSEPAMSPVFHPLERPLSEMRRTETTPPTGDTWTTDVCRTGPSVGSKSTVRRNFV